MTPDETLLWQRAAAESLLTGEQDWDVYALWAVRRVRHTDGREAFLAEWGGGYSRTQPWAEYRRGALTVEEALANLKSEGYVSVEDFRARWSPTAPET